MFWGCEWIHCDGDFGVVVLGVLLVSVMLTLRFGGRFLES